MHAPTLNFWILTVLNKAMSYISSVIQGFHILNPQITYLMTIMNNSHSND